MKGLCVCVVLSVVLIGGWARAFERTDSLSAPSGAGARGEIYLDPREWEGFDVTDDRPVAQKPQEGPVGELCWYYDRFTRVEKGHVFVDGRSYAAASAAERSKLREKLLDYFDRWALRQERENEADLCRLRLRLQIVLDRPQW